MVAALLGSPPPGISAPSLALSDRFLAMVEYRICYGRRRLASERLGNGFAGELNYCTNFSYNRFGRRRSCRLLELHRTLMIWSS